MCCGFKSEHLIEITGSPTLDTILEAKNETDIAMNKTRDMW